MQKLFSTAALCLLAAAASAQTAIKAGTIQLGGGVGYSQNNNDNSYTYYTGSSYLATTQHTTAKSFSINSMAGYFIADNLSVGIGFGQNTYKTSYSYDTSYLNGSDQRSSQLSLGVFAQYYRMLTDNFGLVGTLNASYTHGTSSITSSNGGSNGTSNGFSMGLTPSIVFFPVPKFAVGASIGDVGYAYATNRTEVDNGLPYDNSTNSGSSFGAGFGLNYLAFSGTYYIGR